ncbi:MAG: sugar phosphate nucleotidyltransferase [Myxococcota bacterium]|nr:sugar phosphate nucleotidyltransferase [Myxococcota bacterium]
MKVVLFCGGEGMRLRDYSETIPKPMVKIGYRPILWHVMRYYAHFGHRDFVLCLGHKAEAIKDYFLNYEEWLSNDFVLDAGSRDVTLLGSDVQDWKITFCDTGLAANVGERLKAVQRHLEGEDWFHANYSDGLTDLALDAYTESFLASGRVGSFVLVRPTSTFHVVSVEPDGLVTSIRDVGASDIRINGGYFIFRKEIFDYLGEGEELVEEPFQRLIRDKQLMAHPFNGFWTCMDTFKDKRRLDDLNERESAPWELWKRGGVSP